MKIKSFECPKSIRNYEKKILGMSDACSTSLLSHRPSKPAYYIVDCQIFNSHGTTEKLSSFPKKPLGFYVKSSGKVPAIAKIFKILKFHFRKTTTYFLIMYD